MPPDEPSAQEPCSELLTPELVAFVHGGTVLIVGSAAPDLAPALTRGYAPRVAPDRRTIDVFVGREQSGACLANLVAGASIAVIIGNPVDYRGVQLKGAVVGQRDAGADDADWLQRYRLLYEEAVDRVGIAPAQSRLLWCRDMVRITFVPSAIFRQTPGPGAGNPLTTEPPWT